MRTQPNHTFLLGHKEFYEPIELYQPQLADYVEPVRAMLPENWTMLRGTAWFHAIPPDDRLPEQGWKIHVSGTASNALAVIDAVVPILRELETAFKFALDKRMLLFMTGKNWARGGSGKFFTIYPRNSEAFLLLLARLHKATAHLSGPYILSDKRYPDSKVLFYRYGGIRPRSVLDVTGERNSILVSPGGQQIPDRRAPYYAPPDWVQEPFPESNVQNEESTLKDGRYRVESVLTFKNTGGVYLALDTHTGKQVVIKEARPCVNTISSAMDAVALLRKEHRILSLLEPAGIAPKPLDLFQDWEHWFLVQEYIEGIPPNTHSAIHSVTLMARPSRANTEEFFDMFRRIFTRLAQVIEILHAHGIVFGDLSPGNIIIPPDSYDLKLIDFEAAYETGKEEPAYIYTRGFAALDYFTGDNVPRVESDYFSLGALMLFYLVPINPMLPLKPGAKAEFLEAVIEDIGFPDSVRAAIAALMESDPAKRLKPATLVEVLSSAEPVREPILQRTPAPVPAAMLAARTADYMLSVAGYKRTDRLFPAYAKVFMTNPLSIAYGACGVARALQRIHGAVPPAVIEWILGRPIGPESYAPGLYVGMAGIAWALLELGLQDRAEEVMQSAFKHPLLFSAPDIHYGAAGCGMAALRFFLATGNEYYLDWARAAGNSLIETRSEDEHGCFWKSVDQVYFGYSHGASGIALFLLYLYQATGNGKFLEVARNAMDFEIHGGLRNRENALSWPYHRELRSPILPYWRYGSAGVGTALLRFHHLFREDRYKDVLDAILLDTDRKYTAFPGKFIGLSGIGEYAMDAWRFTGERVYLDAAQKAAAGLLPFAIDKEAGLAFPGDTLTRICCDYAGGGAGIALFFQKLATGEASDLLVDELLAGGIRGTVHAAAATTPVP